MSTGELESFRAETRAWLAENCPPSMRVFTQREEDEVWGGQKEKTERLTNPDAKRWLDAMVAKGYTAPTWPREYGGAGLDAARAKILDEELRKMGCRLALRSFGVWMLGPTLLEFGNEAQKREHLPKIARGEIRWCQGYSEPGAGSDLAGLQCKAVRDPHDDNQYIVSGHKIWTSHADKADWMFCLVRTNPTAPKHEGISFLLIDMASPGISVKPIRLISGASPFCETFLDEVRVPVANRVGPENGGWTIAKALLGHERNAIGALRDARADEEEPLEVLARRVLEVHEGTPIPDAALRDEITRTNMDLYASKLVVRRVAELSRSSKTRPAGAEGASIMKLFSTELNKRRSELRVRILGLQGVGWEDEAHENFSEEELRATRNWLRARANSVEGGTSEIQLNIIARRVLGLPSGSGGGSS